MAPAMETGRGPDRATLKDVAALAGVHPGTASRAINAATRDLVNEETARRVLAAADELGYRPNPIARGLKTSRSYTVGVLIPDLTNPLFPRIVRGIQDKLEESGYTPLIANTDNDPARERADIEAMRARQVDGLITATAHRHDDLEIDGAGGELPVVLVNRRHEQGTRPSVVADDRLGVRLAIEHLVALGHRRIAHLAGPQDLSTGYLRLQGFREALADAGIEYDDELVLAADAFVEEEGERLCNELLDRGLEVDRDLRRQRSDGARLLRRLRRPGDRLSGSDLGGRLQRHAVCGLVRSPADDGPPAAVRDRRARRGVAARAPSRSRRRADPDAARTHPRCPRLDRAARGLSPRERAA